MRFRDIYGQDEVKANLLRQVAGGRVAHAQMLWGRPGVQKLGLALAFAQYVNCTNRSETDSCGVCPSCKKMEKLVHPDVFFVFPITLSADRPLCDDYLPQWRTEVTERYPFSLSRWLEDSGAESKQCSISVAESDNLNKKLVQRAFEAEYKVAIIWLPEKMGEECANKLLKTIEEPMGKTLFLLVSDAPDKVIGTILSRTQRIKVNGVEDAQVLRFLRDRHPLLDDSLASDAVRLAKGSVLVAENAVTGQDDDKEYFDLFAQLMRSAYSRKPALMRQWVENMPVKERRRCAEFLQYAQHMLRESFISNLRMPELNNMNAGEAAFVARFGPFINEHNVGGFMMELQNAEVSIEQNVQAKMVFFCLALQTAVLLRKR